MIWSSISAEDLERMLAQRDVDPIDLVIALYMYGAKEHIIPGATAGMSKEEKELVQRIIRRTDEEVKKHDHSELQFW